MNIQILDKKIELIQWVSTLEDETLIHRLMEFKERKSAVAHTSEKERQSIQIGINDADAGRLKSHAEARKLYEKWL